MPRFPVKCVEILQKAFDENQEPSLEKRRELANETGLQLRQVTKWFYNRRMSLSQLSRRGYTDFQLGGLLQAWQKYGSENLSSETYAKIAQTLGLASFQVEGWFARQRSKSDHSSTLQEDFAKNPYPSIEDIESIARELNTSESKVRNWLIESRLMKIESLSDSLPLNLVTSKALSQSSSNVSVAQSSDFLANLSQTLTQTISLPLVNALQEMQKQNQEAMGLIMSQVTTIAHAQITANHEIANQQAQLGWVQHEMNELKQQFYARFGYIPNSSGETPKPEIAYGNSHSPQQQQPVQHLDKLI